MPKNKGYPHIRRWLVEPTNSSSNSALAEMLGPKMEGDMFEYTDEEGAKRILYEVSFPQFAKLASSRFDKPWQFEWWVENSHRNIVQFEIPIDDSRLTPVYIKQD